MLLQADLSCTPLVDGSEDDGMDLVLFDTRVNYETTRARSHTTLSATSPRLQDLRQELLEACEREGDPNYPCYEMDVELESPSGDERGGSVGFRSEGGLAKPRYPRHSPVSSVFRALKCIEGEELMQDDHSMLPLEVPRPSRPGLHAPEGYASLERDTIDY